MSEARGSGLECQAETAQEQLRGAHPHPRPGVAAGRSYHPPEARGSGREELPHARGQGWQPREATPLPRSSGYASSGGPRGATPSLRSGGGGEKIKESLGKVLPETGQKTEINEDENIFKFTIILLRISKLGHSLRGGGDTMAGHIPVQDTPTCALPPGETVTTKGSPGSSAGSS